VFIKLAFKPPRSRAVKLTNLLIKNLISTHLKFTEA